MSELRRAHLVWAHPRSTSLTGRLVEDIEGALADYRLEVDTLDLYRSGFNPVLTEVDEPDWDAPDKRYSDVVHALADRAQRAEIVVVVFPLWWYALPAMLKGYLDRVWNHGLLYGDGRGANACAVLWVALAGLDHTSLAKRGHIAALESQLNDGVARYCGIQHSTTVLLCDTIDNPDFSAYSAAVRSELAQMVERLSP